jgi:hypothetical protein
MMTDRDYFAAAALTGLANIEPESASGRSEIALMAYELADAMLHERSRAGQNAIDGGESDAKCPERGSHIADAMLRKRERTNLDAAPAARASVESVAPQPTTHADRNRTDKAAIRPGEGTGDTPKPINDCVSDRPQPINGPDPDSRVWETPVHTPASHATPGEGSVPREGTQEPVAWAVAGDYGDYAVAMFSDKASAQREADRRALVGLRPGYFVVPLYRSPTLTDSERTAIQWIIGDALSVDGVSVQETLRGLLERLGGGE